MARAERPLLIAPAASPSTFRGPTTRGGGGPRGPKKDRQVERMNPAFAALAAAVAQRRAALHVDPSAAAIEQVLVIETNGPVAEFLATVAATPGLEWLADDDLRDLPPDEDFFIPDKPGKPLVAQLYLLLFNQEAIAQLLSLWQQWSASPGTVRLPAAFRGWAPVFRQLRDIRRWSVNDRLQETRVLEYWRARVAAGCETVTAEIELWFRSAARRAEGEARVREYVGRVRGQVTATCVVEEIEYHAITARLPIGAVERMLENPEVELLQCEDIRFVRPTGQAGPPIPDDEPESEGVAGAGVMPTRPPVVALLDGLPLENHHRLSGRLIVDDPDGFSELYPVRSRFHGTAMASLILHGDLGAGEAASSRQLYVRPLLRPDGFLGKTEVAPDDRSWVDLIHCAVRRIVEGDGAEPAAAPTVKVINLSIGDPYQPFLHTMSPLAKLLDWLAWRYQVTFVVSAGNHTVPIAIDGPANSRTLLTALAKDQRHRRVLSPSEAINVLTVGASAEDSAGAWTPRANGETDFDIPSGLPSPISGWGRGFRRIVKPDVLAPGGRTALAPTLPQGAYEPSSQSVRSRFPPGQRVAAPSPIGGDLNGTRFISGTSNAAAVTSRLAAAVADALEDLRDHPNAAQLARVPTALWIRTLIVHGASWRPQAVKTLLEALRHAGHTNTSKDELAGVLGFGCIDQERVVACASNRATVLAGGVIRADQCFVHRLPMPPSLNAYTGRRRLTLTLSWFSPVNPSHRRYRRAALWFDPPRKELSVKRVDVDWMAVRRGTVQHEVLEGERTAVSLGSAATLDVPVSCMADAGSFDGEIAYAFAATIEVPIEAELRVYDEIRTRLATRVPVRP